MAAGGAGWSAVGTLASEVFGLAARTDLSATPPISRLVAVGALQAPPGVGNFQLLFQQPFEHFRRRLGPAGSQRLDRMVDAVPGSERHQRPHRGGQGSDQLVAGTGARRVDDHRCRAWRLSPHQLVDDAPGVELAERRGGRLSQQ